LSNTPTQTFDFCVDVTAVVTEQDSTPTPTPTHTTTPTPTVDRDNTITSGITYVIDNGYFECGDVGKLVDCDSGEIYLVSTPIVYQNNEVNKNKIIRASINGIFVCATYEEDIQGSSTHNLSIITSISDTCGSCQPTPTPTPTNTATPTPTLTPTPTNTEPPANTVYVYTGCGSNIMIVQGEPVPGVIQGQVIRKTINEIDCWEYVGMFNEPYFPPSGFIVSNYSTNYIGSVSYTDLYISCGQCQLLPTPTPTMTSTPNLIECTDSITANEEGAVLKLYKFNVNLGSGTGTVSFNWDMGGSIPDRFMVFYNGSEIIDTKFVGPLPYLQVPSGTYTYTIYDNYTYDGNNIVFSPMPSGTQSFTFDETTDNVLITGQTGTETFNKTTSTPEEVEVWVFGHTTYEYTNWSINISCPT